MPRADDEVPSNEWLIRPDPAAVRDEAGSGSAAAVVMTAVVFAAAMAAMVAAGDAGGLCLACPVGLWFGWCILRWRHARWATEAGLHPLAVAAGGQVRYWGQTLVPAGTARAVEMLVTTTRVAAPDGDDYNEWFQVFVLGPGGERVELPAPYFTNFSDRHAAERMCLRVSELLGVPVRWTA